MKKYSSGTFYGVLALALLLGSVPACTKKEDHSAHEHHAHHGAEGEDLDSDRPSPSDGQSVYHLSSPWTTMDGKSIPLRSLQGKIRVVAMVFTSCQYACPVITADMFKIRDQLSSDERKQVGFVLLSIDPERDNPEALRKFMSKQEMDAKEWILLTAEDEEGVMEAAAVLGVKYKKLPDGDFAHSNIITVLDESGVIRHQQVGLNRAPNDTVAKIREILKQ